MIHWQHQERGSGLRWQGRAGPAQLRSLRCWGEHCLVVQVPVAIGGPGLPKEARFRTDLKEPGLANVGPTIVNLLGFKSPSNLVETLLA